MTVDTTLKMKDLLGPAVALIAVVWGILQYRASTLNDFIKPLREAQLSLYQQASSAAAGLATLQKETLEWQKVHNDFLRLFYGPLTIFEDFEHSGNGGITVEKAMIAFKTCLDDPNCSDLKNLSLGLGHTCRISLGKSWGYDVPQLHGDYQILIQRYFERSRAQNQK